ncbi:hypothetical protein [Streptomyces sp. FH025]|uniref:hypothetical protein n=1 Tax=Streptomyces sp. FH025 TaxID=2815937 RepID=UPI001A9FF867|nr:hypothetical protein [Streptomyces sp. FH025]MBO1415547.1 hypothetical protein [Streptomyces sp. FH025]
MTQASRSKPSAADRPITWREATIYVHGALTTLSLHNHVGWPTTTAASVGLTGPVLWELLRRQR